MTGKAAFDVKSDDVDDLQRDLDRISDLDTQEADRRTAGDMADAARRAAYAIGGVAAKAAPSIGTAGDEVTYGGPSHPYAGGAEFGSNRFKQFKPWRGSGDDAGYFLYPAIRDEKRAEQHYDELLDDELRKADLT